MKNHDILPDFTPKTLEFGKVPCYSYQGTVAKELTVYLSPEEAIFYLKLMRQIRSFETMIIQLRSGQLMPYEGYRFCGATHISIGEEAVAVGAC